MVHDVATLDAHMCPRSHDRQATQPRVGLNSTRNCPRNRVRYTKADRTRLRGKTHGCGSRSTTAQPDDLDSLRCQRYCTRMELRSLVHCTREHSLGDDPPRSLSPFSNQAFSTAIPSFPVA